MKENKKEATFTCGGCLEEFPVDQLHEFDGRNLCSECLEDQTALCSVCGERIWSYDNAGTEGTPLCQLCYDNHYTSCDRCGALIRLEEACYAPDDEDEEYPMCQDCYTRMERANAIQDYYYTAISQHQETDMAFLARVCLREGYAVKVTDGSLVVYSEKQMEAQTPQAAVDKTQTAPGFDFDAGTGLLSSAEVRYFNIAESRYISQTVTDPEITGGALRKNEFCSTDGEAQRWAYGYLRAANKTAHTGTIQLLQQSAYAAGSVIDLSGFDEDTNGLWFVWGVDQDAVNARTTLHLRRPLSY